MLTDPPAPGVFPGDALYVGGTFRQGGGEPIRSLFPADGALNTIVHAASQEDVTEALARARRALDNPSWRDMLPHRRAACLARIADAIDANRAYLAWLQSRDTGKTLRETTILVGSAADTMRYYAAVAETAEEAITPSRGDYLTLSRFEPIGIIAAITPWNSPIASDVQKLAPALAAGNAVILKPSPWSPLTSLALARIIDESGLPKGLVSVLPGGAEIGARLVEDPAIGRIVFTGGTTVGRRIAETAGRRLVPVSLELGGKSPTIVRADADLDLALSGVLFGIFSSSGQSCIAGSRLFVHRSVYEVFRKRLVAATEALVVGHPFSENTQVAPMIHADHRDAVERWVERARAEGGTILTGGARPEGASHRDGYYYLPTIIEGLTNESTCCREEIFGPVLALLPYDDDETMIAQANDNRYGLACGIWSTDLLAALALGRRITTGTVWINTYKQFSASTPFGGEKDSGLGREKGLEGMRAYMVQKSYYIGTSATPHPWAGIVAGSVGRSDV